MPFKSIVSDNRGATAVEYGLIAAMFVLGAVFGLETLGTALQAMLGTVSDAMATVLPQ